MLLLGRDIVASYSKDAFEAIFVNIELLKVLNSCILGQKCVF